MWPWEHAVFGYLLYSLLSRVYYRDSPDDADAVVVVFASVLPDLIDKPLAWYFGILSSGYALGHSVFVAIPMSLLVGVLAWRNDRTRLGVAFGVGYLSHLPGDVVPYYLWYGNLRYEHLLWPVVVVPGTGRTGFADRFMENFGPYATQVLSLDPTPYLVVQLAIAVATVVLWFTDGTPGIRWLVKVD